MYVRDFDRLPLTPNDAARLSTQCRRACVLQSELCTQSAERVLQCPVKQILDSKREKAIERKKKERSKGDNMIPNFS